MTIYESCPSFYGPKYSLRQVCREDAPALLKVYSDPSVQPYINADGYPFKLYFTSLEEMEKCIDLWLLAYQKEKFVRWTILDERDVPVGTLEMSVLKGGDQGEDVGLLRMEVGMKHEYSHVYEELLYTCLGRLHELFGVRRLVTKAVHRMLRRKVGLCLHGFFPSQHPITIPLKGVPGEYGDYWGHTHFLPGEEIRYPQGGDAYGSGDFPELRPGYGKTGQGGLDRRHRRGAL